MSIGQIILLSIVGLVLIIVGSCFYMAAMMNVIFVRKHVEIDQVLSTGLPPEAWQKRYYKKLVYLKNKGASDKKLMRLTRRQQKHNIAKLKRLTRYIKRTNLVEDESARGSVLTQLEQCKQHCQLEGNNQNGI